MRAHSEYEYATRDLCDGHSENLRNSKREAKRIAKSLGYNDNVMDSIDNAKNESDITKIMRNARTNAKK